MNKRQLFMIVSLCGVISATVGLTINVAGLFYSPIANEFQVLRGSVGLTATICNLCFAVGGLLSPWTLEKFHIKKVMLAGAGIMVVATALLGLMQNMAGLYVLNALRGLLGGLVSFYLLTAVINNWFTRHVGLITSITFSFSGVSGAVFSPILSRIIETAGWRQGYFMAALFMVCLYIPAFFCIPSVRPKEEVQRSATTEKTIQTETEKTEPRIFWLVLIGIFLSSSVIPFAQYMPGLVESYALPAAVGATMTSLSFITNSAGKIFFGFLSDRKGTRTAILLYSVVSLFSFLLLWNGRQAGILYVAALLFGVNYSFSTIVSVLVTKDIFGLRQYATVYPKNKLAGSVAYALASSYFGYLFDFTGSYRVTMTLSIVFVIVSLALFLIAYRKKGKAV